MNKNVMAIMVIKIGESLPTIGLPLNPTSFYIQLYYDYNQIFQNIIQYLDLGKEIYVSPIYMVANKKYHKSTPSFLLLIANFYYFIY